MQRKGVKVSSKPIEHFDRRQMQAPPTAPDTSKKKERRNQMMLILLYDTAVRVTELLELTRTVYIWTQRSVCHNIRKGRKYRNIPLMDGTCSTLKDI